jgi:trk system potassium uptake protein TrkH
MKRIFRLLSLIMLLVGISMIAPLGIALTEGEASMVKAFGFTMAGLIALCVPILLISRKQQIQFSARDGFLLVFLSWVSACLIGAVPFFISRYIPEFSSALFESVSGFTTTGTTLITDLNIMPRSLLFWRGETHWLGGMGIVVLTVALLPLLGVGGFQLVKAETPGPEKDRLTPKITETAKLLWIMYMVLTAVEALLLMLAGMGWFDAVLHSFSTMATGGFSSRNESIAAFHSPLIEWIILIFMLIAGFNFSLFFRLIKRKFSEVFHNSEARAYILIVMIAAAIISISLISHRVITSEASLGTPPESIIRKALFFTASIITTTGFSSENVNLWPPLAQGVLLMLMLIGGCSGSTAGGVKVVRHLVLFKQAGNELRRVIYPRGVFSVRLNDKVGRKDVVYGVSGFIFLYFSLVAAGTLVTASSGMDLFSSLNASLISLGNIGLGLGKLDSASLMALPVYVKWFLSFMMIAGRLELWTAFVFFSRAYWR